MEVLIFLVVTSSVFVAGQRPFYAGSQPIGVYVPAKTTTTESLGDRVGEETKVTTLRLPLEANGDRELFDRLSKLPIDKQPFGFINWQALEDHRKNPQTYPLRPNTFISPITPTPTVNSIYEFATVYSNSGSTNSNSELGTTDSTTPNYISTVTKNVMTTNDNASVTNSLITNSVITTTTEIQSIKIENTDSEFLVTGPVRNSDSEFITEDPSFSSSIASSSSLPPSNFEITTTIINID